MSFLVNCFPRTEMLGEASRGRDLTLPLSLTSYNPSNPNTGNQVSTEAYYQPGGDRFGDK